MSEVNNIIKEFNPNYGLDIEKEKQAQSEQDWVFGATGLSCIAENIPEDQRGAYLPVGEVQRGKEDMFDCASRGALNVLEAKFNWLFKNQKLTFEDDHWLRATGYLNDGIEFSDAFIAILSGTTRQGNSMRAPLDTIRKNGLIPKRMLPLESWMTWEDYHNSKRITSEMKDLGLEFLKRFSINYEKVYEEDFKNLIKKDFLNVAGFAWPDPVNGEYPRIERDPNHVFVAYKSPLYFIFDNYLDPIDGDFTKKLASNYDFMGYGYRILINKIEKKSVWILIINLIRNLFK